MRMSRDLGMVLLIEDPLRWLEVEAAEFLVQA